MNYYKSLLALPLITVLIFAHPINLYSQTLLLDSDTQKWFEENVNIVTDLDEDNLDFSQFDELKKAIGDRSIVLLGEQTHGDGTTFEAKVRLVKFLHKEMGFDTLIFESGFYQSFKVWDELNKNKSFQNVVPLGIHEKWSGVEQIQPVFSYVQEMLKTETPLKMTGMDVFFDGRYSKSSLLTDFNQFLEKNYNYLLRNPDYEFFETIITTYFSDPKSLPTRQDQKRFIDILDNYIRVFDKQPDSANLWNTDSFWAQVWRNYKVNSQNDWSRFGGTFSRADYFSNRDRIMAENLDWIYRGEKKIIVWASVTHNMRNFPKPLLRQMKWSSNFNFMGEYLSNIVGPSEMFHISFTGYEGFYADVNRNNATRIFSKPSTDSMEALLDMLEFKYGYFMLNKPELPAWFNKPFKASFVFNEEYIADWSKSIDAVFFTRKMEASRPKK